MGDFVMGVLSGLASAALIAIAGIFFYKLRAWHRFRPFHQVWFPFTQGPSLVVITGKQEGHTIKVSVNESRSAEIIHELLGKGGPLPVAVSSHDSVPLGGKNVIALGSAPANEASQALLQSLGGRLHYAYTADKDLIVNGELFRSAYRDNILVRDYALVCKADNPFSPGHKFLVFAGNHGIGTQGGVLAVTSAQGVNAIVRTIGKADFFAVIETSSDARFQECPTSTMVVRCGILTGSVHAAVTSISDTREERLRAMTLEIGGDQGYLQHVGPVAELAVRIANAIQSKGVDVDIDAVYFGAMLHDIGRTKSNGIDHGLRGCEILQQRRRQLLNDFLLMPDTIDRIDEAVGCHIVGGIPSEWIQSAQLGIPERNYVPRSLEAKLVALSDQLLHNRHQEAAILREAPTLDIEVLKRIFGLTTEVVQIAFGVTRQEVEGR